MDTSTLKRELDANKRNFEIATQAKRRLTGDVMNLKSKHTTYKRDAEIAATKAEQYKKDFEKVSAELEAKTEELKVLDEKIATYTQDINKLDQDFRKLSEEMRRATQNAANSNKAPYKNAA